MRNYCAAGPSLLGYPLRVKIDSWSISRSCTRPHALITWCALRSIIVTSFFVLGCASHSKFMGGVPFSLVLRQFLIARQYRDGCFLRVSPGKIAQAVASRAGNYYARDSITGLCRAASVYLGLVPDHFSHFSHIMTPF